MTDLFKLCRRAAHWPPMMVCFPVLQIKSQAKAAVTFEGISVVYGLILIKFCRHTANWATIIDGLSPHISVQMRCVYAALIGACFASKTCYLVFLGSLFWETFDLGKHQKFRHFIAYRVSIFSDINVGYTPH